MVFILGTGAVSETRNLTTFSIFSESIAEKNKCNLGPVLTIAASVPLILLSIWAVIKTPLAQPNAREEQAGDQMLAQLENQRYDQRPMMFAMGFVMLLVPYLLLLEPELAYRLILFLRLAGIIYMGLLALYLNPETMISHHWTVYLLGSSIGFTLLILDLIGRIQPGWLEIFLFLSFGLFALLMKPLILFRLLMNQSQEQHGQQPHDVAEPGQIPQAPPPIEPRENKGARPNVQSDVENAQKLPKSTSKHSKLKPKKGDSARAAQCKKLQYVGRLQRILS